MNNEGIYGNHRKTGIDWIPEALSELVLKTLHHRQCPKYDNKVIYLCLLMLKEEYFNRCIPWENVELICLREHFFTDKQKTEDRVTDVEKTGKRCDRKRKKRRFLEPDSLWKFRLPFKLHVHPISASSI